jgi:hypothetical protein
MASRRRGQTPPTRWSRIQLNTDRQQAIANFRDERLLEPAEDYGEIFDRVRGSFENLLETTVDLTQIYNQALPVLSDPTLLRAFRYVAGPPISEDDLKTLADTTSLSPTRLRNDPDLVDRIIGTVMQGVDHRRFPWLLEGREAQDDERDSAILSSSSLAAMRGLETKRRNQAKDSQQDLVRQELLRIGLLEVATRPVPTLSYAPGPGEFCGESYLAGRKADFIVGLWDHRVMAIECKVSNSSVNSVKRLNHEASAKAEAWINDLGAVQVIPVAILSGVYSLDNLEDAQQRGLTIYWAHRLTDLGNWILSFKP